MAVIAPKDVHTQVEDPSLLPYGILHPDRRFSQWGKLIMDHGGIDLSKKGGFALTGQFARWDEAVAVHPGEFLVLVSETGSRANHPPSFALIGVSDSQTPFVVDSKVISSTIDRSTVPDEQRAKAKNSKLYTFALYASIVFAQRAT